MNELHEIVREAGKQQGQPFALATIVATIGSSYRRLGTRMLITGEGETVGALSAGCLERDIVEKAINVVADGEPLLRSYDTRALFGCDGRIDVFVEPMDTESPWLEFVARCFEARHAGVSLTLTKSRNGLAPGTYPLRDEEGNYTVSHDFRLEEFRQLADEALVSRKSRVGRNVLFHYFDPPTRLIIVGAGEDCVPVTALASSLGWLVTVLARPDDNPAAFESAEILPIASADEWNCNADRRTALIIMSHQFGRDYGFLQKTFSHSFAYIGLLGPRQRRERLLSAVAEEHGMFQSSQLIKLYNPAGLDLGAETPAEIALAIIAEIQAVLANQSAGFLRERKGAIHSTPKVVAFDDAVESIS